MTFKYLPILSFVALCSINRGLGDSADTQNIRLQSEVQPDGQRVLHGMDRSWHPDGSKWSELQFRNGKKIGRELEWDLRGNTMVDRTWKDGMQWTGKFEIMGEGLVEEYQNGQLVMTTDLEGIPANGPHISNHGDPYRVYVHGHLVYEDELWSIPGAPQLNPRDSHIGSVRIAVRAQSESKEQEATPSEKKIVQEWVERGIAPKPHAPRHR